MKTVLTMRRWAIHNRLTGEILGVRGSAGRERPWIDVDPLTHGAPWPKIGKFPEMFSESSAASPALYDTLGKAQAMVTRMKRSRKYDPSLVQPQVFRVNMKMEIDIP